MMNSSPDYKRLFQEAQQEIEKEQRRRKEADRARQEADRARHQEQLRREEADRARQEADKARQREQSRREEADRIAASALPQSITDFLEGCHSLYRQINPVVDLSSATTGNTTDPVNRLFPPCITP